MTNRERIAEMKVVDFFSRYAYCQSNDFDRFICDATMCLKCSKKKECKNMMDCKKIIREWLDEEVSE